MTTFVTELKLYTCIYKQTYYITVAANDLMQARGLFEIWLKERGVEIQHHQDMRVTHQATTRPVYGLA